MLFEIRTDFIQRFVFVRDSEYVIQRSQIPVLMLQIHIVLSDELEQTLVFVLSIANPYIDP